MSLILLKNSNYLQYIKLFTNFICLRICKKLSNQICNGVSYLIFEISKFSENSYFIYFEGVSGLHLLFQDIGIPLIWSMNFFVCRCVQQTIITKFSNWILDNHTVLAIFFSKYN